MAKRERTPEQRAKDRDTRAYFQAKKPTLDELVASGEYHAPVKQGDYLTVMQFMARFKSLREQLHLSLSDIECRSGIDRAQISRFETGVADNPTISTLERLARSVGKRLKIELEDCPLAAK